MVAAHSKRSDMNQRTLRIRVVDRPGQLAEVLAAIGREQGLLGDIRTQREDTDHRIRDVTLYYTDYDHLQRILAELERLDGVEVLDVIDAVFMIHQGGKLDITPRVAITSIEDLQMVYTPGVAHVCKAIELDPARASDLTMKGNTVAIVTNGTAVLGLGDIGPIAGLPVMEGKAMLLKQFGNVAGFPILVESHDPQEIIATVQRIAPGFGAIQLEDIAAPDCFLIEEALEETLDIPVMHDDQHGTATVALAGLMKAVERVGKQKAELRVVLNGAGAAGIAIANILLTWGVQTLTMCDSKGIITPTGAAGNVYKRRLAERINPDERTGDLATALEGADAFIGVSKPGLVTPDMVRSMRADAIVFPLANPVPEIWPEDALEAGAAVAVDGRSLNNALAFPGIFRGLLDARATHITMPMKVAAAEAIASFGDDGGLLPSILNMEVHAAVAAAVAAAAVREGVARAAPRV